VNLPEPRASDLNFAGRQKEQLGTIPLAATDEVFNPVPERVMLES
jgi:hypothetical protein